MLFGAVLLFLIGGMPFLQDRLAFGGSFVYRDLLVPDDANDGGRNHLRGGNSKLIFEPSVPARSLPNLEPSPDQDLSGPSYWNRRNLALPIWIE